MSEVTLQGKAALAATIIFPAAGVWHADVEVANSEALADVIGQPMQASLQVSDVMLTGTILPKGGVYDGRGWFRVVGGANGWGTVVAAKGYRSGAGVKASTVLADVARDAGEQLGPFTDTRIGGWFARANAEARDVIEYVTGGAWYVDETGKTQLGARPTQTWSGSHRLLDARPDRNWVRIAADTLVGLVPGAQLEGLTAATVRHELEGDKLHSTIWGTDGATPGDRLLQRIIAIIRATMRPTFFHGLYQFRITGGSGGYLNLQPMKKSIGLPSLNNVPVRVGSYGARGTPTTSSTALVGFMNGDPSLPFVHSFDGEWAGSPSVAQESDIFATIVKLGDATATALASANKVANELAALQAAHNGHTHIITGTVPITGAAGTTAIAATAAPTTDTYTPGSVACSKAMGV
jgi:hypothetical protein